MQDPISMLINKVLRLLMTNPLKKSTKIILLTPFKISQLKLPKINLLTVL